MPNHRRRLMLGAVALACMPVVHAAGSYPAEVIHVVVPSGAGSFLDTLMRQVGERLSKRLGQPVIVDDKAGASGMIAYEYVQKAKPDGYTLGAVQAGFVSNRFVYKSVRYDEFKDFVPVAMIARSPMILVTSSNFKAKNLEELRKASHAAPGKLTYASVNGANYLNTELMRRQLDLDITHIPYKETGQAMTDTLAGTVDTYLTTYSAALPLLDSGKLRVYATLGKDRLPTLPDIPSGSDLKLSSGDIQTWAGLVAPAGTPPAIVARLHDEIDKIVGEPGIRKHLREAGFEPFSLPASQIVEVMKREMANYTQVAKDTGIRPE